MRNKTLLLWIAASLFRLRPDAVQALPELTLQDGTEFEFDVHAAEGDRLMIWIPSEDGPQSSEAVIADALSRMGIEVWRACVLV